MEYAGDIIDWNTFGQIIELDEDSTTREFSRRLVSNYYEQAEQTFAKMDAALAAGDLSSLSNLGHFLKGSSASLGLIKVEQSCEEIQYLDGKSDAELRQLIDRVRAEHKEVTQKLDAFYNEP